MKMKRPSPAMLVALIALAVALGGTATAARNLIIAKDIAPGAITARHLAPGAVTTAKIAPSAVTTQKLAAGARSVQVASLPGPQGAPGPAGPAGPQGPAGGLDPAKVSTVEGPDVFLASGDIGTAIALCPAGQRATGGGFFSSVGITAASLPGTSSWGVIVNNDTVIGITVNAYVVCVAP